MGTPGVVVALVVWREIVLERITLVCVCGVRRIYTFWSKVTL